MNRLIVAVIAIFICLPGSYARTSNTEQMLSLSPETRLEQRCNARAMGIVGREHRDFHPDEFVAYAFADPLVHGNSIKAPGGAVRSRGKWFHVSYECQTTADGLEVESFSYSLGSVIPRDVWEQHFLVP